MNGLFHSFAVTENHCLLLSLLHAPTWSPCIVGARHQFFTGATSAVNCGAIPPSSSHFSLDTRSQVLQARLPAYQPHLYFLSSGRAGRALSELLSEYCLHVGLCTSTLSLVPTEARKGFGSNRCLWTPSLEEQQELLTTDTTLVIIWLLVGAYNSLT